MSSGLSRRAVLAGGAGAAGLAAVGLGVARGQAQPSPPALGVVIALEQEILGLEGLLTDVSTVQVGRERVALGLLSEVPIAFVVIGAGKVNAAVGSTLLVERFGAQRLLWTGTAGSFGPHLRVGDIVVADRAFQWDFDARPFIPQFEIGHEGRRGFPTDPQLRAAVVAAARAFLSQDLDTVVPATTRRKLDIRAPRVVVGTIASGDRFGVGPSEQRTIAKMPNVQAVDFEGAACAQAGYDLGTPTAVVRSISNVAGAPDVFALFLARAAGAYSTGIVRRLVAQPNLAG
jgi:adenosylhomocysteine nucleosidase